MFTAIGWYDLHIPQAHSLKDVQAVVSSLVKGLQRRFAVSAAEVGHLDVHQRSLIGVAVVAGQADQVRAGCERFIRSHPELEVIATTGQLFGKDD